MPDLKIAIILGSTRPGRKGKPVADWVVAKAAGRTAAQYELVDLADNPLPHIDEPMPPSLGQMFTDFENLSVFAPGPQHDEAVVTLFDQLESWTQAMKGVREMEAVHA